MDFALKLHSKKAAALYTRPLYVMINFRSLSKA
ncbi:hypothetical protein FP2506_08246 [Fulvimarina pelagi HTCC2506]|uniref:Uncharacterized protein n=1 Tax=Fulvimarina pelagi HTCC2506 TaxID=314231 RepID=Q0G697_9HYPH|nr:hypothetical protein FP2506_08246 [Fulvimarina pelagi HTCC2506]